RLARRGLRNRRPAGQGGGREPRTSARRFCGHWSGAAGEEGDRQSGPRRPAQGRQPFRPAHRPGPAGLHGGDRTGRSGRLGCGGRTGSGRSDRCGGRNPACGDG
ncbi:hypothetical protein LTR94_036244, partial [Friedmanniomyces endolithicus]